MKFGWDTIPTPPPTPNPSPFPSPAPSPAPTSSCVIDVNLDGCPQYNSSLDNDCQGRPWEITFRYNGGDCSQSDNLQPRQKFSCVDNSGGPSKAQGTTNYITAVPRGGSDLYFAGNVAVGEKYTLNEDRVFDKLSADMTITIFESQGGALLQTVDVHLSCSQPLFLFDKFGSSQVTQWVETSGRVVTDTQTGVETGTIEVALDTSNEQKPVRLLEMTVLTDTQDQPIDYTSQVAGQILAPGSSIELPGFKIDIELGQQVRYTFFTTIIGETLDGTNMCNGNDMLECIVGFNLNPVFPTMVPTPSPTITPLPTNVPNITSQRECTIGSQISCAVIKPEGVFTCETLKAPVAETCPAGAELLRAFLRYDGSLGPSVFLEITCDSSEYIAELIQTGQTAEFNTRGSSSACVEATATVYGSDPLNGGSSVGSSNLQVACPGPWTLGATIAPGFILDSYVSSTDNGITFDYNTPEVEIELNFIGQNEGSVPLTITSGETVSPLGTGPINGLPTTVAANNEQILLSQVGNIQLSGQSGQTLTFSQVLFGVSDAGALPCEVTSELVINL